MRAPATPPSEMEIFLEIANRDPNRVAELLQVAADDGKYLHWDELRHRPPPGDLSHQEWWFVIRHHRRLQEKDLPLKDKRGAAFKLGVPDFVQAGCHRIDRDASGRIEAPEAILNQETRGRYVVNSLMEEAATSSILEGAATTVAKAKDLLRSGAQPRNRSDRMVINNYRAMQFIRQYHDKPLTAEFILDLHSVVTDETLEDQSATGRFRHAAEDVVVEDRTTREVLHVPPKADELEERVERLCAFANGDLPDYFIHPVVRAILVHFGLAYDHPFVDGNGRTARALFYWCMLNQGYRLTEFLSISKYFQDAPVKYGRAFLHTESDGNDCTYFIKHHLTVIERALATFREYLAKKASEIRATERALKDVSNLNHRQIALVSHALRHSDSRYTIASHQNSHQVVYQTARQDLLDLCELGILTKFKIGRAFHFIPAEELRSRLGNSS